MSELKLDYQYEPLDGDGQRLVIFTENAKVTMEAQGGHDAELEFMVNNLHELVNQVIDKVNAEKSDSPES